MAARKRFRLLVYENILNRWWPATLAISLVCFLFVGVMWGFEWYHINPAENPIPTLPPFAGEFLIAAGSLGLLFSVFLLVARKNAYVQLFPTTLRVSTPFLRLDIPYKRINRTQTAEFGTLFASTKRSEWEKDMIAPLNQNTAILLQLTAMPMPQTTLRLFLSRYFFVDKTPHIVLLVDDWMAFSTRLESARVGGLLPRKDANKPKASSYGLLNELKKK